MNDRSLLAHEAPMIFAGSPLDRCEAERRDPAAIEAFKQHPQARLTLLVEGDPILLPDHRLEKLPFDTAQWHAKPHTVIFLGKDETGPLFAAEADLSVYNPSPTSARQAAMTMPHRDSAIYAHAKSILAWHDRHRFCAVCGTQSDIRAGGAKRICPNCGAEHFPRVDPVVIMLALDGDKCLLGRQSAWPERMWSALAGFVEPAETFEEACAREIKEETGVDIDIAGVRYVFTQPWPFPSSIMIGLTAPATSTSIHIDEQELEQARWFSRDEVSAMLAGTHSDADLPPSIAVARRLTELWAAGKI